MSFFYICFNLWYAQKNQIYVINNGNLDKNDWYTGLTVAGTGDKILMSHDCTIAMFSLYSIS